jgi:hypothetical protein
MVDYFDECIAATVGLGPQADGESLIARSFLSPDIGSCSAFHDYRNGRYEGQNYWRFWHGYQIFLRPLLFFFDLGQIRFISFAAFVCLAGFFVLRIARFSQVCAAATIAALLCVPAANQVALFPHMAIWAMSFSMSAWLLRPSSPADSEIRTRVVFLGSGMLCSFLSFFIVPLLSLTIPLLALYWKGEFAPGNNRLTLRGISILSTIWLTGYATCWASKWILAACLLGGGAVTEQLSAVMRYRLGTGPGPADAPHLSISPVRSILLNVRACWYGCWIVGALLIVRFRPLLRAARSWKHRTIAGFAVPGTLFAMPIAWLLVVEEHSILHAWFVGQIYFTSFALLIAALLHPSTKNGHGHGRGHGEGEPADR